MPCKWITLKTYRLKAIETEIFILLFVGGLLGGFIGGLLGIGGAPIYLAIYWQVIPRLYPSLGEVETTQIVIANTVLVRTLTALSGCYVHIRNNNFYTNTVISISISATIVSLLLIFILSHINYTKNYFSIFFIIVFLPLLYQMLHDDMSKKHFNQPNRVKIFYLNLIGILCGAITALTGLGAGFVVIPLLNNFFNIKIRKVASISLGVIFFSSIFIVFYYVLFFDVSFAMPYSMGALSLPLLLPVIIAGFIASPWGVKVSQTLSPKTLRYIFIAFCGLIVLNEIWQLTRNWI